MKLNHLFYTNQLYQSSSFLQVYSKHTHKLAFCTRMFISQLNIPFKHKE